MIHVGDIMNTLGVCTTLGEYREYTRDVQYIGGIP